MNTRTKLHVFARFRYVVPKLASTDGQSPRWPRFHFAHPIFAGEQFNITWTDGWEIFTCLQLFWKRIEFYNAYQLREGIITLMIVCRNHSETYNLQRCYPRSSLSHSHYSRHSMDDTENTFVSSRRTHDLEQEASKEISMCLPSMTRHVTFGSNHAFLSESMQGQTECCNHRPSQHRCKTRNVHTFMFSMSLSAAR